jgi:hypothetical protein
MIAFTAAALGTCSSSGRFVAGIKSPCPNKVVKSG